MTISNQHHSPSDSELPLWRLLAFALPALPIAAFQLPVVIIVPKFYADTTTLSLTAIGIMTIVIRLIDAICDPFIGYLADHYQFRWGRRRTWFALASIPTGIGALMLFNPFPSIDVSNVWFWGWWFFLWSVMMSIGYTALSLTHQSWASELSYSYFGRNRVFAMREVCIVLGTLIATGLPLLFSQLGYTGDRPVLLGLSLLVGITLPLFTIGIVSLVPENKHENSHLPFWQGVMTMWNNVYFCRLLVAFALSNMANSIPATLLLYFVRDYIHGDEETQRLLLLAYFLLGVASTPLWLWLSHRTSKHRAWSIAMLVLSFGFVWAPFIGHNTLGQYSVWAFSIIMILAGAAVGADFMLPPSMQADVIDVDTAKTGNRSAGFYFAIWALATKIGISMGTGIGLLILGLVGFDKGNVLTETASSPVSQTSLAMWTLAILYAWVPVLLKLISVFLIWNFPLGAEEQEYLRRKIIEQDKQH